MGRFSAAAGANPLQVMVLLACLALSGYAFYRASLGPLPVRMAVWFIAAVIAHDLILYPLYALADRSWHVLSRTARGRMRGPGYTPAVPAVNYLRVPTLFSGLLLIVFWPSISGGGSGAFHAAAGLTDAPFLGRWLLITATLYGVSAVLYAANIGRARRAGPDRGPASPARRKHSARRGTTSAGSAPAETADEPPSGDSSA